MIYFSVRTLQPRSFTKIAYNETLFEVSWLPPKDDARVNNYTVFWCLSENHRDRPYQVQYKNIFVKLKFRVLIEIPYVQLLKPSCTILKLSEKINYITFGNRCHKFDG